MADIKFLVSIDTKSGQTQLREFSDAIDGVGKTSDKTKDSFIKTSAAFAAGQAIYAGVAKAARAVFGVFKDGVRDSTESEESQNRLKTALASTGRSVEVMLPALQRYAIELAKETLYTDEQAQASMTLLAQYTDLDTKGIQVATRGAMGLATVMKTDLESATRAVLQGIEGNYTMLGKYIPEIRNATTDEAKHAAMMKGLAEVYQQSTAATQTFGGRMKDLGKWVGEVKESFGGALTENKGFNEFIEETKNKIIKLIESGKIAEWADIASKAITGAGKALEFVLEQLEKLQSGKGEKIFLFVSESTKDAVRSVDEFQKSLKILKPSYDDLEAAAMKGAKAWADYTTSVKATDDALFANKKTIADLVGMVVDFLGLQKKNKDGIDDIGDAASKSAKKLAELKKEFGLTFASDIKKKIKDIQTALENMGDLSADSLKKLNVELDKQRRMLAESQGFLPVFRGQWGDVKDELDHVIERKTKVADWVEMKLPKAYSAGMARIQKILNEFSGSNKIAADAAAKGWAEAFDENMQKIQRAALSVTSQISATSQQFSQNEIIRIENAYAKKKQAVLATVKDEEKKNAALQALDQEMDLQKRSAMRKYAAAAKAVALMEAAVNTAAAATSALKTPPPWLGMAMAITIGALGAARMAAIASQPIPLAKGAIFTRPTLLTADTGSQYQVAEAGEPEVLSSPRQLRQAIFGAPAGRSSRGTVNKLTIPIAINIAGQRVEEKLIQIILEADELGKLRLRRAFA